MTSQEQSLREKIDAIIVKAVAMHNQRGTFDDTDKVMMGKWSEEITQLIQESNRQARVDTLKDIEDKCSTRGRHPYDFFQVSRQWLERTVKEMEQQ